MSCIEELVNKAGILVKDYNEVREIQYRSKLDKRPILTTDGALGLFFETEPENMPRTLGDIQPYLDEIEMSNDQIIIERVIPQQRAPYWEVSIKRNQSNIACAASIEKQTAIFAAYKKWARVGAEHGNYNI